MSLPLLISKTYKLKLLARTASTILVIFFMSCKNEEKTLTANDILSKSIESSGGDQFMNSLITFDIEDFNYRVLRRNNIKDFQVVRQLDTIQYKAIYKNGYSAYFINDIEQEAGGYSRKFIDTRLEGLVYILSIPHVFNQNATILTRMDDVIIDRKPYYCLYVTFKAVEDEPKDEFYLYIDQETFFIDFYAYSYDLTGGRPLFKKAINRRIIQGIPFSDFWAYTSPEDTIRLEDFYKLYNIKSLNGLAKIEYKNITVKPLEKE